MGITKEGGLSMKTYIMDGHFIAYRLKYLRIGIITQNKGKKDDDKKVLDNACFQKALSCKQISGPNGYYLAVTHRVFIKQLKGMKDAKVCVKIPIGKGNIDGLKKYMKTKKCDNCLKKDCKYKNAKKKGEKTKEYFILIKHN